QCPQNKRPCAIVQVSENCGRQDGHDAPCHHSQGQRRRPHFPDQQTCRDRRKRINREDQRGDLEKLSNVWLPIKMTNRTAEKPAKACSDDGEKKYCSEGGI